MITQLDLAGHRVRPYGQAPRRFAVGRVCVEPDCLTRLSTYNRHNTCFRHSPIRFPRTRGRAKAQ